MRYEFTVTFTRDKEDDLEIGTKRHPGLSERETLLQQLRDEIQESFNNGVAGEFNILRDSYREVS